MGHHRSPGRALARFLVLLGVVQIALLVLAVTRVFDPGRAVFDVVGFLAGLGMAGVAALIGARYVTWRSAGGALTLVAVASGLVSAADWLPLAGQTFSTGDHPRLLLLAAADTIYVLWLVWAAIALRRSWIPCLRRAMLLLVIRSIVELASLPALFASSGGPGTDMAPVLMVGLAISFGWMVLAAWEVRLGAVAPTWP